MQLYAGSGAAPYIHRPAADSDGCFALRTFFPYLPFWQGNEGHMETESPPTRQFFTIIRAQNAAQNRFARGRQGEKSGSARTLCSKAGSRISYHHRYEQLDVTTFYNRCQGGPAVEGYEAPPGTHSRKTEAALRQNGWTIKKPQGIDNKCIGKGFRFLRMP